MLEEAGQANISLRAAPQRLQHRSNHRVVVQPRRQRLQLLQLLRILRMQVGIDGDAEQIDRGAGIGAGVFRQHQIELAGPPRRLQKTAEGVLLQPTAAAHGQAQAQLLRMSHLTFAGIEAMTQQHHRTIVAGVGRRGLRPGFLQQLVGEGGHHGSGNGAALPEMEWRQDANVTG